MNKSLAIKSWGSLGAITAALVGAALFAAAGLAYVPAAPAAMAVQSAQPAPDGGGPTTAPSTEPGGRRGRRARTPGAFVSRFHDMVWSLDGLSDDQKTKLTPIFDQAKVDAAKLTDETRGMDQQEQRQKMRSFMQDLQDKVNDVLTDDQKAELQEKMAQMRPGGGRGGGGGGGGGPTTQPGG